MISIILPSYCPAPDVEQKLKTCLESLYMTTDMDKCELVVVEQAGRQADNYLSSQKLRHPYIHVSYNNPVGFSEAVNAGVRLAHGDMYAIVNNDIVFSQGWLDKMVEVYKSNPLSGLLAPIDQHHSIDDHEYTDSWWSCVLISRDVWNEVGELDTEHLRYRYHDQDWSIRCHQAGYKVQRTRRVKVYHDDGSTYRHMKSQVDESAEADYMIRTHGVRHFIQIVH